MTQAKDRLQPKSFRYAIREALASIHIVGLMNRIDRLGMK